MKAFIFTVLVLIGFNAYAWDVQCGSSTIYYASGGTLVSQGGTVYYKSGGTLISQGGTAYFASGGTFKSQGDTIYYASGGTLKSQGGTYYYENGATARSQGGTLYRKDGSTTVIPFSISVDLGAGVIAKVKVQKNTSADSDIEISVDAGSGEILDLNVSPSGVFCSGLGSEQEVAVTGRAGTALLTIKSGHDVNEISRLVQQVLDSK